MPAGSSEMDTSVTWPFTFLTSLPQTSYTHMLSTPVPDIYIVLVAGFGYTFASPAIKLGTVVGVTSSVTINGLNDVMPARVIEYMLPLVEDAEPPVASHEPDV